MSVLQALVARYERMIDEGDAPLEGYAPAKIHFTLVLRSDGALLRVEDERRPEGKTLFPKIIIAPEAPKSRRGEKIVPGTFWDPVEYALGIQATDEASGEAARAKAVRKAFEKHAAFKQRHERLLSGSEDEGAKALLLFLGTWDAIKFKDVFPMGAMGGVNIAFRLDDELRHLHERPALRAIVVNEVSFTELKQGYCLVSGQIEPIERLHSPIKGVGDKLAPLISFNEDAFESYGMKTGANAAVSVRAAFAYATALNSLLSQVDGRSEKGVQRFSNRIRLGGDTVVVFWAETREAEAIVGGMLEGPPPADDSEQTARVRDIMSLLEQGRGLDEARFEVEPSTKVYILGLSPNAARLSVRFWREDTLGGLAERFREHWADLRLDPPLHGGSPPVWRLLLELAAQRKPEHVPAHLAGEITRSILTGARYPMSMLTQTILRIRADQDRPDPKNPQRTLEKVSPLRIAMLKAWLARDARKTGNLEDLVTLDLASPNTAYRLGRLFAVLERLQRAALGQRNATVRDRFYASASATPGRVFPLLIRNAGNHSKKIRSTVGGGLTEWFEDQITEAVSVVGDFPATLDLQSQGRFALGYYHQREALNRKRAENKDLAHVEETSDATETEEA